MAAPKSTNFNKFFKCMLIGQLSQCSLTKLFRMQLKTTKHHESHRMEKPNELFGQPSTGSCSPFLDAKCPLQFHFFLSFYEIISTVLWSCKHIPVLKTLTQVYIRLFGDRLVLCDNRRHTGKGPRVCCVFSLEHPRPVYFTSRPAFNGGDTDNAHYFYFIPFIIFSR